MLGSAGVACRYGGRSGVIIASAMCGAWFATGIVHKAVVQGLEAGVAVVDLVLFIVVLLTSLRSSRWWPMLTAASLGLNVALHGAVIFDPSIWGRAIYVAEAAFSYLAILGLGLGSYLERDRPDRHRPGRAEPQPPPPAKGR